MFSSPVSSNPQAMTREAMHSISSTVWLITRTALMLPPSLRQCVRAAAYAR
jgi:hypothetical protein